LNRFGFLWIAGSVTHCAYFEPLVNNEPDPTKPVPTVDENFLKKRILVLKLQNKTPYGGETLSAETAAVLKEHVSRISQFIVVSAEELAEIDSNFGDPLLDPKPLLEKARAFGIHAVVMGSIEELALRSRGDEVGIFRSRIHSVSATIKLRIVDSASGREVLSRSFTGETTEEHVYFFGSPPQETLDTQRSIGCVSKALEKLKPMLPAVAEAVAWEGHIARIDLHRYYINSGELSGLRRGHLLKVNENSSGLLLGKTSGRIKGFLRVVDYFGKDGAVANVLSGSGFREKDRVQLYIPPPK